MGQDAPYWLETGPTTKMLGSPLFRHQRTPALKKQRRERSARAHKWYEKEYAVLDKLYNRGISREEYERRVKIITDDLNGVAADDR